jgi:hypothetical protein
MLSVKDMLCCFCNQAGYLMLSSLVCCRLVTLSTPRPWVPRAPMLTRLPLLEILLEIL